MSPVNHYNSFGSLLIIEIICSRKVSFHCRIIPESAHSAYDKAAQYFNIKLWRMPVNKNFQADLKAIRRHINKNTILVVT